MKVENIKKDIIFKSYKHMCEVLELKVTSGNSKVSQFKELDRYCRYHKEGNKIIIDEVFNEVKPKEDNRGLGFNSIYSEDIQPLILDMLAQDINKGVVCLSCNKLLNELQMVNKNYAIGRNNIPELSKLIDVEEDIIYDFYNYTHTNLKNVVESALNSLRKQSLLDWSKQMTVCIETAIVETNELGQPKIINKCVQYTIRKEFRLATDEEIQIILRTEIEILSLMGYENISDIVKNGKWEEFKFKINKELRSNSNIQFYYYSYKIVSNPDIILNKLGRFDKVHKRESLNNIVIKQIENTIDKKHMNSLNKIEEYNKSVFKPQYKPSESHYLRAEDIYCEDANKVKSIVIPRKSKLLVIDKEE